MSNLFYSDYQQGWIQGFRAQENNISLCAPKVEAIVSKINSFNDGVLYLFYIDTPHANAFCM